MSFCSRLQLLVLATAALIAPSLVSAADWNVVVNGKAIHIDSDRDWNENNWGLGFEREFESRSRWVRVALGNGFIDSESNMSYMGGGGIKRRFNVRAIAPDFYVDVGAVGFLMTRQDINNNRPFPGILPALTIGMRNFAINMTYLPGVAAEQVAAARQVDPGLDGILYIQFKLNARLFMPSTVRRRQVLAASGD